MMLRFFASAGLICCLALPSCAKKSDDDKETTDTAAPGSLNIVVSSAGDPGASSFVGADPDSDDFNSWSIMSGSPDELVVYVKKMSLVGEDSHEVPILAAEDDPKPIKIRGKAVNISDLFTKIQCMDADGNVVDVPEGKTCECGIDAAGALIDEIEFEDGTKGCPELAEGETPPMGSIPVDQTGDFTTLRVSFAAVGEMKGCLTGKFKLSPNDTTTVTKTACTQTALGAEELANGATPELEDYPETGAEMAGIALGKSGSITNDLNIDFNIKGGITIGGEETPTITLMIDRGRLLRFYWNNGAGSSPSPDMPSTSSYFFTTIFENSTMVFVGQPGDILGYKFTASAIRQPSSVSKPADNICLDSETCTTINGWVTAIMDKDGLPLAINVMPDDDNVLTVLKGGNYSSNPGELDPTMFEKQSGNIYNVGYNLGDELSGTIYAIDFDAALDTEQVTSFYMEPTTVPGESGTHHAWGALKLTRKL